MILLLTLFVVKNSWIWLNKTKDMLSKSKIISFASLKSEVFYLFRRSVSNLKK